MITQRTKNYVFTKGFNINLIVLSSLVIRGPPYTLHAYKLYFRTAKCKKGHKKSHKIILTNKIRSNYSTLQLKIL
jgi:hypothetical protein